ncbi:sulfatase-like hydrolase/transferase [Rubrobacter tropicus]|uniref:Sulfatase-like hydrolase/transferase n=1 Tax=Rubrobacter tropicus TaxID=2653851 RepID=A0A6G8Q5W9_9ACTN|nr:sulfatase [Rubrobacter tropicus]QIN81871.1 sulfatase-like hydrolase/transferase [Rubrobacter tropicus]
MSTRPNVVVIVSDTFRRDHLGAYGNTAIHTPNLDAFARQSAVFDHHVVSSFPTMPARADILTGTFSYTHMGWEPLPGHLTTLPEVMSRAGYATMGVVDTPFYIRNGFGYDRGFDDFIWVRGQGDDTRPQERSDARSTWTREEDRLVARTMTEAERWLERHRDDGPFFLYVDTWDPHEPWDAPDYYTEQYRKGYDGTQIYPAYGDWREAGLTEDDVGLAHATYCGEVTMVDFWIGRFLGKLDALNLTDDTIVVFTSDHGFYFGEHGYFGKAEWINDQNAVLAEDSVVPDWLPESWLLTVGWSPLYKELTNVPLMVRAPGLEPGRRSALTTAPDLAPTVLDLAGVRRPPSMQGESFGDVLVGDRDEHRPFVVSSWPLYMAAGEFTTAVDSRPRRIASYMPMTVTTRERSLILGGPAYMPELYDLVSDPGEQSNVWESGIEEGAGLGERALSFLERQGTPELYLAPRRLALKRFAPDFTRGSGPKLADNEQRRMHNASEEAV